MRAPAAIGPARNAWRNDVVRSASAAVHVSTRVHRVHRLLLRISIDAEHGGRHAVEVIVLQILSGAEHVAQRSFFPCRYFLSCELCESCRCVGNTLHDGRLQYFGRKLACIKGLPGTHTDFGEPRHQFRIRGIRRAERKYEVQNVKELRKRSSETSGCQRLDESNRRRSLRGRSASEKRRQRAAPCSPLEPSLHSRGRLGSAVACDRAPSTSSVSDRITFFTPLGASPFQCGPAIRKSAALAACRATTKVVEVKGVGVDEHHWTLGSRALSIGGTVRTNGSARKSIPIME